jgi:tetratricopeptide (TPR) repeat protein
MSQLPLHILLVFTVILVITGCPASALSVDQTNNSVINTSSPDHQQEVNDNYEDILHFHPQTATSWGIRGMALYGLGKYDEAIEAYNQALNLSPKDPWVIASKGNALVKLGKYNDAIEMYDQVLSFDPDYDYVWNAKGLALSKLGKYQEAIGSFDKAIEIDPDYTKAIENKEAVLKLTNT